MFLSPLRDRLTAGLCGAKWGWAFQRGKDSVGPCVRRLAPSRHAQPDGPWVPRRPRFVIHAGWWIVPLSVCPVAGRETSVWHPVVGKYEQCCTQPGWGSHRVRMSVSDSQRRQRLPVKVCLSPSGPPCQLPLSKHKGEEAPVPDSTVNGARDRRGRV